MESQTNAVQLLIENNTYLDTKDNYNDSVL